MEKQLKLVAWIIVATVCAGVAGCACQVKVPDDARLVWAGPLDSSDQWRNLAWLDAGQLYLVDGKSGRVLGVRTIWPEQPKFAFAGLEMNREYRLYFRSDPNFVPQPAGDDAADDQE